MKLICGMPRSGTKYLLDIFNLYGMRMKPKMWSHRSDDSLPWSTNESGAISYAFYKGVTGYALSNLFIMLAEVSKYDKDAYAELVYKQPQLCFLRSELIYFSEIIICRRPVESWIKSACKYDGAQVYVDKLNRPAWLKKYEDRFVDSKDPFLVLGQIWEENINELIEFLEIRKCNYHVCDFGNVEHYRKLFEHFELDKQIIEECLKRWNGSQVDDNYKSFEIK